MDKNTGLYIVFGFLLLCILLSLDKKEGFATINVSSFETACNTGGNTCIVAHTGSLGGNCLPSPHEHLYNLSTRDGAERDTHKESFNITAISCSESGFPIPGQTISAQVCSNEGEPYTLSGCDAMCTRRADSETGYNVTLPLYVSPIERDSDGNFGVKDTVGGSCGDGLIAARDTCFNRDGSINGANSESTCLEATGIWYNSTGTNPIKLVCDPDNNPNYSVIGCEPACLSRDSELNEYMATPDDLNNPDKEIIQILHRTEPLTSDVTEVIMPQSSQTPYLMEETRLNPVNFLVTGTSRRTNFYSEPDGTSIPIDFAGTVESSQGCNYSSPNTDLQRKYPVSGLFPVCDPQTEECLNFNITYDSEPPLNITDFKESMNTIASEIGISNDDLENYKKSLYYYRRYKDRDDKIHIEGQIRCNNNDRSPFHCIITDPITWILGDLGQNCDTVCGDSTCITPYIGSFEEFQTKIGHTCEMTFPMTSAIGNAYQPTGAACFFAQGSYADLQQVYNCSEEGDPNIQYLCKCQGEPDPITWILGEVNQSCDNVCGDSTCMVPDIDSLDELSEKMDEFGHGDCNPERGGAAALGPYLTASGASCRLPNVSYEQYSCGTHNPTLQRLCKCQG